MSRPEHQKDGKSQEEAGTAEEHAPTWVTAAFFATLGGGVLLVVAELVNERVLAAIGLAMFTSGIIAMSASVVLFSRRTDTPLWLATWKGIRAAGSLLWNLAP